MRQKSEELDSYFKNPKVPFIALNMTSNFDIPRAERAITPRNGNDIATLVTNPEHLIIATDKGRVRKLIPREYDRLMSWGSDYTKTGVVDGEEVLIPKTARYRCCGNGVVSNVVKEIISVIFPN